jgi:TonB family protein
VKWLLGLLLLGSAAWGQVPEAKARASTLPRMVQTRSLLRQNPARQTSVRLRVHVSSDGRTRCEIVESSGDPVLDAAVLQDLQGWWWTPAQQHGQAVESVETMRLKLQAE